MRIYGMSIVTIGLALSCAISWAQSVYRDVIYLKNGGIVEGELLHIENGILHIRTHGESQTEILLSETERIAREPYKDSAKVSSPKSERLVIFREIGCGYSTGSLRTSRGVFNYVSQSSTFLTGAGIYLAEHALLALGTGYSRLTPDRHVVPLFGEFRMHLVNINKPLSPYFLVRSGYSLGWRDTVEGNDWGGAMLEIAAGIKIHLTRQHALYAHAGYQQQQQRIELINLATRNIWSEITSFQFWGVRLGVLF